MSLIVKFFAIAFRLYYCQCIYRHSIYSVFDSFYSNCDGEQLGILNKILDDVVLRTHIIMIVDVLILRSNRVW